VLQWLDQADLGFEITTLSLGGESAGANIAAVVSLMTRDRGGRPITAHWLDVPAVDISCPMTPSVHDYGTGYGLEIAHLPLMQAWYLGDRDVTHPYVSPINADLAGLPPALITTAELDPIRDQGKAYADALEAAGVPVTYRCATGHIHASGWLTGLDDATAANHAANVADLVAMHHEMQPLG
jgi:acetyl esterase